MNQRYGKNSQALAIPQRFAINRRRFLKAGPTAFALSALGAYGADLVNRKPRRVGLIGAGWYGKSDVWRLNQVAPIEIVSLCDPDKQMLAGAVEIASQRQKSKKKPRTYGDFREMLKQEELDIVLVASPDHWQAVQITDAAVFYSRLSRWEEHFDQLPPHQISVQLYFKLDYDPGIYSPTMTHFVVDISETLEQKMSSLLCYRSQFPPAKERFLHRCRSAALHVGSLAGYRAGEMFVLTRTLGTVDPMKLLFAT